MPSFSCDGCCEVIKKAKLDQHSYRCSGFYGFSCLDCCAQFQTAASWKAHTSCITEQEKYHGSFYTPKKNAESPTGKRTADQPPKGAPPAKKAKREEIKQKEKKKEIPKSPEQSKGATELFAPKEWSKVIKKHIKEQPQDVIKTKKLKKKVVKELLKHEDALKAFLEAEFDRQLEAQTFVKRKGDKKVTLK